jgi:hypothetical protein
MMESISTSTFSDMVNDVKGKVGGMYVAGVQTVCGCPGEGICGSSTQNFQSASCRVGQEFNSSILMLRERPNG